MSLNSIFKFLLLAAPLLVASTIGEPIKTQEIQFSSYNPFTVAIGSHLFTVSKYISRVIINSTDPNYKSCEVTINSKQGVVIPPTKVAATSSKKIVVASFRNLELDPSSNDKLLVDYTILVIDPFACTLIDVASPMESVSGISPLVPPEIVIHGDNTFDVFYWSQTRCSPCRFDDSGKRVKLQRSLKPESTAPMYFHLQEIGQDQNYAYALNFGNDRSALKVLDRDFNVLDSTSVDPVVNGFAVRDVANASYIGVVVQLPNFPCIYNYTLFEFGSKLKPAFSNRLKFSDDHSKVNTSIVIDSSATSYVTQWQSSVDVNKVHLTRYDANGRSVDEKMEIARVDVDQNYSVQSFLLEDKRYCLVVHELYWDSALTRIKCFDFAV